MKILRPGMLPVIHRDLGLLDSAAWLIEHLFADGKRLRPRAVVSEFSTESRDELDVFTDPAVVR